MVRQEVRLTAMSDLHGYLPKDMQETDVVLICGDIVPLDCQRDNIETQSWLLNRFFPWCMSLPCDKVLFIAGNHDFFFEWMMTDKNGNHQKPNIVMKRLLVGASQECYSKIKYLENSSYDYRGYKFYGCPFIGELHNWAFYKQSDELKKAYSKIPDNADVLMTHCPPAVKDYGFVLQYGSYNYMSDFGCHELKDAIEIKKPRLSVFGHIHSGNHKAELIDGTMYCNVSLKDEGYRVSYLERKFILRDKEVLSV